MADIRRRLRTGTVVLSGLALLAAALTGCSSSGSSKRCVDRGSYSTDKGYKVVENKNCSSVKAAVDGAWYYGGTEKKHWVRGGSFTKPVKTSGTSHSSKKSKKSKSRSKVRTRH